MTLARTADLLRDASIREGAVPAFNVITLEHAEAIAEGAAQAGSDAILQVSENAVRFHGGDARPLLLACQAVAETASTRLSIHLDHFEDERLLGLAILDSARLGVSSIMVDASRLPYDANVAMTKRVVDSAHGADLWVEAELGEIGGKDGAHAPGVRTDPVEAAQFVASTGVDGLAVAVGSSHAMRARGAALDLDLIARIAAVTPVPLVLHGSSGVSDELLQHAVRSGIRKVNVGTALNVAGTAALRAALADQPTAFDPRAYTRAVRAAMAGIVGAYCDAVAAGA